MHHLQRDLLLALAIERAIDDAAAPVAQPPAQVEPTCPNKRVLDRPPHSCLLTR
jgi:hypothetical protein